MKRTLIAVLAGISLAGSVVYARITGTAAPVNDAFCAGASGAEACIDSSGNVVPTTDNAQTAGTSSLRFSNVYTNAVTNSGNSALTGNLTVGGHSQLGGATTQYVTINTPTPQFGYVLTSSGAVIIQSTGIPATSNLLAVTSGPVTLTPFFNVLGNGKVGINDAAPGTLLVVSSGVVTIDGTSSGLNVGIPGTVTSIGSGGGLTMGGPAFAFGTCGATAPTQAGNAGSGKLTLNASLSSCAITWTPACTNGSVVDWLDTTVSSPTVTSVAEGVASSTITYTVGVTKNDVLHVRVTCY